MGKEEYRFKFSALMSNSWFYKLKDLRSRGNKISKECGAQATQNSMEKSQIPRTEKPFKSMPNQKIKQPPAPPAQPYATNRPSCYISTGERAEKLLPSLTPDKGIDTTAPEDNRRISEKKNKKKLANNSHNLIISSAPPVLGCSKQSSSVLSSIPTASHFLHSIEEDLEVDFLSTSSSVNPPDLPPILTRPRPVPGRKQSPKNGSLLKNSSMRRRSPPPRSQQIKVRIKSPKLAKRKGLGKSFVVVKTSSDPEKDFRESMEEMIVEKNLCSLKELEELLACYLALNSSEYHDLIVKVFKQIWFHLPDQFILQSY